MLRMEIIHTCSNAAVAEAALRSLGQSFYSRIALLAGAYGVKPGAYAASLVLQFSEEACEDDWYALGDAMSRRDMPLLAGFKFILESSIDGVTRCSPCAPDAHKGDSLAV